MNMVKRLTTLSLFLLFGGLLMSALFGVSCKAASQPEMPALTDRIVDNANLISPQLRSQLSAQLVSLEKKTGDQIVIATITSLNGYDIETYANTLFRRWQLGQKEMNNGILLLVSLNDRSVRIEVGYGLEGTLTDALSSIIINTMMVPNFRDGNYEKGIAEGVKAIEDILTGNEADFQSRVKAKQELEREQQRKLEQQQIISKIIIVGFFLLFVVMPILAAIFGKKVGPKRYKWLGIVFTLWFLNMRNGGGFGGGFGGGGDSGSFGGGGFSGGGGSSGGGGASGRW